MQLADILDTFRGLPTHVLVVHAVVVLVPLCFVGALVAALSRTWRQRLAVPIVVLLAVSVVSAFIATQSGDRLKERVGDSPAIEHHESLGTWVPWFTLLALVLTAAWFILEQRAGAISVREDDAVALAKAPTDSPSRAVRLTACVLAVAACAFATGWIAATGEAGSRAHWAPIVKSTNGKVS